MQAPATTQNDPYGLVGTTLAEKYRIERLIGEGGFGVVYAGTHLVLNVPIAVKCLKPVMGVSSQETQATEQFLREARLLFSLTHPSIVRLYDVGQVSTHAGAIPYVVLELLSGLPLDQEIAARARERRPFDLHEIVALFEPVLEAIAFAHQQGVSHRDMKPSNVMLVTSPTGKRSAKVLDFGTARAASQDVSLGTTGFTPRYASPEQWDPNYGTTGPASDLFSLGLVLAEVCTLEPAFPGSAPGQILAAILNPQNVISIRHRRPDLPEALDGVVRRATERPAHARFASATEMLEGLRAAGRMSAGPPVTAYQPPPPMMMPAPAYATTTGSPMMATGPRPGSGFPVGLAVGGGIAALLLIGGAAAGFVMLRRPAAPTALPVTGSSVVVASPADAPPSSEPTATASAPTVATSVAVASVTPPPTAVLPTSRPLPSASSSAPVVVQNEPRPVTLRLPNSVAKTGQPLTVSFSAPLDKAGDQYWITLIDANQSDKEWGDWHYVKVGDTSTTVSPKTQGAFEVRLHDRYPKFSEHVVARVKVLVVAPATPPEPAKKL
jgi:serine/threonine protein kinase